MQEYFALNRFDFFELIEEIYQMPSVPNRMTDEETGIELYEGDTIDKAALIDILQNFNELDNLAQLDAKRCYEKSNFDIEYFQFIPSWIEVSPEQVTVGYVGECVNTDFDMTFQKIDGKWHIMEE